MNKVYIFLACLLFPLYMTGCSGLSKEQKQKNELEKLATEVMEVHDRSMPNHGKLVGLKKKLLTIHDNHISIDYIDEKDSLERTETLNVILSIDEADKRMMDWMHTYKEPDGFLQFDEKKAYYIEQKRLIEEVEVFMNQSIDKAKKIIDKYDVIQ